MGLEARCRASFGAKSGEGMARLEEKEITFGGGAKFKIALADVKKAEAELKSVEKAVSGERQVLDEEVKALQAELDKTAAARNALVAQIDRHTLAIFETTAKGRKGIAVSEARDGMCMICHVRLRPQVFNEVRRNDSIIQCDSCRRILYFVENAQAPTATSPAVPQA